MLARHCLFRSTPRFVRASTSSSSSNSISPSDLKPSSKRTKVTSAAKSSPLSKDGVRQDPWDALFDDIPSKPPSTIPMRRRSRLSPSFFSSNGGPGSRRSYSTSAQLEPSSAGNWDAIFRDIDPSPLVPNISASPISASRRAGSQNFSLRRQAMTAREVGAFDDMFTLLFGAQQQALAPSFLRQNATVGHSSKASDLFIKRSRLRQWTKGSEGYLDRKKEEMELCDNDQQLLQWALTEMFQEPAPTSSDTHVSPPSSPQDVGAEPKIMDSPAYPHLLSHLMRTFRDKYRDPHLALSIFDHARHHSIASYVYGCTTAAYNELIETKWGCFRDLRGVHDALQEMHVNGVEPDACTRKLVETLRREVGERTLWQEEASGDHGEVWSLLKKIEKLTAMPEQLENRKPTRRKGQFRESDQEWKFEMDNGRRDRLTFA